MKNNKDKKEMALNDFLNVEEEITELDHKEEILHERTGLIERVNSDRILVTSDGRQLLREQY